MRRSFLPPLLLAAAALLLVVSGQLGFTGEDWARGAAKALELVRAVGWPLLALMALGIGLWTRERAALLFGLALLVQGGLSWIGRFWMMGAWIYPLSPLLLALAVRAWVPKGPEGRPSLLFRALLPAAAVLAGSFWLYLAMPAYQRISGALLLTALQALFWILLAAAGWSAHRERPMLWLGALGVAQVLVTLTTLVGMFGLRLAHGLPVLLFPVVLFLPFLMAAGLVGSMLTARSRTREA